ncbi:MAG: tRNA1(Val) (adenine(37)-N6)-methyltransferase [Halanaerobiaceae bacterium]|nr:tRNA1(Val) (adenine(37)-N6)-methyltransferase [Halanaerobiaceae bacterium]
MEETTVLIPGRLYVIQNPDFFKFGSDSVFLAEFTEVKPGSTVVDFGTGSGVIPLLLAYKKKPEKVIGIEIQDRFAEMARKSVEMNGLTEKIEILQGDFTTASEILEPGTVDIVVTNPPYMPVKNGKITLGKEKAIARHEIYGTLEDVIREAAIILKYGGKLTMVHKVIRLTEIICLMKKYELEPKRIRLIQSRKKTPPKTLLIEARKGSRPGLEIEPVLLVYEEDSEEYTREVQEIYGDGY